MDTTSIEILLTITRETLTGATDYRNVWVSIKGGESEIEKTDVYIKKLQMCIDQLNKLKDLTFPTDQEIREYTVEIQGRCCQRHYIYGLTHMREIIKNQLEDGI